MSKRMQLGLLLVPLLFFTPTTALASSAWVQLTPTGGPPPPRSQHTSVYDPASNRLIIFGGCSNVPGPCNTFGRGVSLNDLWVLANANGQGGTPTWIELTPTGAPPPARFRAAAVYDSVNNRMVIWGGDSTFTSLPDLTDVWVLTNANGLDKATGLPATPNWSQLFPTGGPPTSGVSFPGREVSTAVYDSIANRMIVFGGDACDPCTFKNDVWALTNANGLGGSPQWLQLFPTGGPPAPRVYHSAVYDAAGNRMVIFGGTTSTYSNDTWVLANASGVDRGTGTPTTPVWTQLAATGTLPPARGQQAAAYDAATNRMVIFGGADATSFFNDVWLLDNANGAGAGVSAWRQILPTGAAPAPRALFYHYELYDGASNRMLLFGGESSGEVVFNDSWVLTEANGVPALAQLAATRAITLLNAPYGYDGKGYDFLFKKYQDASAIFTGYNYFDTCNMNGFQHTTFASGVDCSGLVMWSYNTAFGATTQFALSSSGMNDNPVIYPSANNQYLWNTVDVSEANLQAGDLMFFDFDHDGTMDHVAMYLGGDNVIQAPQCGQLVQLSSKSALKQLGGFNACGPTGTGPCFRRVSSPIINIQFVPSPDAPVSLAVTDPDGLTITSNTITLTPREALREVANVLYYNDADQVFSPVLKTGAYLIQALPKQGTHPTDTFSLTATAAGSTVTLVQDAPLAAIPPLGYGIISTGSAITPFIPVAIDIKPGDSQNAINPKSHGKTPVAVLSSATFNALSQVDVNSLTFGRSGTEASLAFCNSAGEDVNGDGLPDLVCHFDTQNTNFQTGDRLGILEGRTTGGEMIRGTDSVVIVP